MELLPAAFFLVPGAVAAVAHRFAAAQTLTGATQLLLAIAYSGLTYALLGTPIGAWLVTPAFPGDLFNATPSLLSDPDIAWRLLLVSGAAGLVGLLVGRLSMSQNVNRILTRATGRNLYSSVWIEAFRGSPPQWVRLRSGDLELVGWLRSASDAEGERSLLLSNVYEVSGSSLRPVVGDLAVVRVDAFPVVVLLGRDVATALARARARKVEAPPPAGS